MKKDIYSELEKSRAGTILAVMIIFMAGIITAALIGAGAELVDLKYFIIVAAVLVILLILVDIIANAKNKSKFDKRKELLSGPSVDGKITEVKTFEKLFIKEHPAQFNFYTKYRHRIYRLLVEYRDPSSGNDETILSRPFIGDEPKLRKGDTVNVYCSSDGEAMLDV